MTAPPLDGTLPLHDLLRPHVPDAVEEIEREVRAHVPEYARAADDAYGRVVRQTINETVACFIDSLDPREPNWVDLTEMYARLGAEEARRGHSLDSLQTALRLSSQVACRRFIMDAYRFRWPKETLNALTGALFALLARAADAAAQGYAREQGTMATARERRRARLRDLLVRELGPGLDALAEHARAVGWDLPRTIAVVALTPASPAGSRILPPDLLADWDAPFPYLVVPDPDAPGQRLRPFLERLGTGAIGPTVPVTDGATSLRWARHAVTLVERGVLRPGGLLRCVDHTAVLAAATAEDLVTAAARAHLGPILALPARRRTPLLEAVLTYLECGENAVATGRRLNAHEQTVRYRLRRVTELTGLVIGAPETKPDLILVTNWLLRGHPENGV